MSVLVSVVIPVYNDARRLVECLSSLSSQTLEDFEALIVDNNSTDESSSVIRRFKEKDSRFKGLFCAEQGVSNARNMGIRNSDGKYVFF